MSADSRLAQEIAERQILMFSMFVGDGTPMPRSALAEPMIEHQLRKAPLPVDMWSRWPQLRRPIAILVVSLLMATAAVGLR